MTVEAGASEFVYIGDGVTTTFPFPSRFLEAGDIAVGVGYVEQTSGYTVLGAGAESGGAVVFSVAPPAGAQVALLCRTSPSQLVDFVNGQTVLEGVLNNALDRRALVEQYLLRCVGRSLRLADFDPVSMPELPGAADRAGKLVGFSQSGAMALFNGASSVENMAAAVEAAQAAASDAGAAVATLGPATTQAIADVNAAGATVVADANAVLTEVNVSAAAAAASQTGAAASAGAALVVAADLATKSAAVGPTLGFLYATTPDGLANTPNGSYFRVSTADGAGWKRYKNSAGTAVFDRWVIDPRMAAPSSLVFTRSSNGTSAFYTDAPAAAYSSFTGDQPITRTDLGLGLFPASTNYFLNSTAPATQTITLATGTYIVSGNGTGVIAVALGTAVGTGTGTLTTLQGNFLTLNITTGGTIVVTVTGSVSWAQVEKGTVVILAQPTPMIVTAGASATRNITKVVAGAEVLGYFQAAAGTVIISTDKVAGTGTATRIVGANTATDLIGTSGASSADYFDAASAYHAVSMQSPWLSGLKVGLTWDATYTAIGGGVARPVGGAHALNSGTAITAINFGSVGTTPTSPMSGWIKSITLMASRLSDDAFQAEYTSLVLTAQTAAAGRAPLQLPKWRAACFRALNGRANARILVVSDSTSVNTASVTNAKASSWPVKLAALLTAAGYPASANCWFGSNRSVVPNTAPVYDTRLSTTGTITFAESTLGGSALILAAGATVSFVADGTTDTCEIHWNTATGNGNGLVSVNGGGTLATLTGNATASLQKTTATATAAANTWTITASGGPVRIEGMICSNSTVKEIQIIPAGRSGFTASNFTGSNPLARMALIGANLTIIGLTINDAASGTALATYQAAIDTLATTALSTGDVMFATGNPVSTASASQAAQDNICNELRACASGRGPVNDIFARWSSYATLQPAGYYLDTLHPSATPGYDDIAAQYLELLTAR